MARGYGAPRGRRGKMARVVGAPRGRRVDLARVFGTPRGRRVETSPECQSITTFIHTSKTKESWFHPKSFKHFDGCLISNAECATASYTPNMSKILPLPIEITVTHPCIDEKPRLCHITLQETAVFAISSQFWILEVKISCAASFVFFFQQHP